MKWLIAVMTLVLIAGLGCSPQEPQAPERQEVGVLTTVVELRDVPDEVQSVGTVEPRQEAALSARMMGLIISIKADEGDRVSAGDTLVVIDAEEIRAKRAEAGHALEEGRAALKEALAALDNADINYSRIKSLYDDEAVSRKELDDMATQRSMAEARVEQAKARIAQARSAISQADTMIGYSVISSPVRGVVVSRMASVGETAAPGMPLMKIVNDKELRLVTTVRESGVSGLKTGLEAVVVVDALSGVRLRGVISEIIPAADPATRSFVVKVDLPAAEGLMPGMFARAMLPAGVRQAVLLPAGTLVNREGVDGVFVVGGDSIIRFQAVSLGRELDGGMEVLAGLSGGERVAVGDIAGVREGMKAVTR